MKIINKLWNALVALIELTDKIERLEETVKRQQQKLDSMNERLIRLETAFQIGASNPHASPEHRPPTLPP
ncbi:hypothetical protein D3C72_2404370 [compost metagenome]